jgi:hypothetical protein
MKRWILWFVLACLCLSWSRSGEAALRIEAGNHTVPSGSNQLQIPIQISGGDLVTDMVGAIQIGDGGPLVGGEPGPVIRSISYVGSIWSGAAGGFDSNATINLPAQLYDPNVSLRVAGQKASGVGRLFLLTIDLAGVSPGLYELRLAGVQGLSTTFQNAGTEVPVTIVNGLIAVNTTIPTTFPRLSVAALSGGPARLGFPSEAGRRYRVQWAREVGGQWSEVRSDLLGTGAEIVWMDDGTAIGQAPGPAGRRFYRVRVAR